MLLMLVLPCTVVVAAPLWPAVGDGDVQRGAERQVRAGHLAEAVLEGCPVPADRVRQW